MRVQLDALRDNDEPWPCHGVQTAYEFALGVGGMDPCPYFNGVPLDLYHFDHFQGKCRFTARRGRPLKLKLGFMATYGSRSNPRACKSPPPQVSL